MLYIVGTPIGNIQDISYRAIHSLIESDIILAEDTRSFSIFYQRALELFSIPRPAGQLLLPFHDQNEFKMIPKVLDYLRIGKQVSLVSESGMPTISDPGRLLVESVRKNNLEVSCVPGPMAFTSATSISGLSYDALIMVGFFSKKKVAIQNQINHFITFATLSKQDLLICAYESPHRLHQTIEILKNIAQIKVFIARELTKKFEEFVALEDFDNANNKGEFVLLIQIKG